MIAATLAPELKGFVDRVIVPALLERFLAEQSAMRGCFSYTQQWEQEFLAAIGGVDYGCADFTAEVDRRALGDDQRIGPGNHTNSFEVADGWLAEVARCISVGQARDNWCPVMCRGSSGAPGKSTVRAKR